jgi:excisionase family DNA binding protein
MNGLTTIGDKGTAAPLPRLYLRPDEAALVIGVSRRTLSAWQSARVIGFRRVGRTILFSIADIQSAIDRYRIAPIGEPKPRQHHIDIGTINATTLTAGGELRKRKRRIQSIVPEPATP